MKRVWLLVPILVVATIAVFVIAATVNYAQEATDGGSAATGGQPGTIMSWGAGARALAMGKAFTGVADDATAAYWNPAGLAQIGRQEATALHAALWGGTSYDYISYAYPIIGVGTVAMSGVQLSSGGFEKTDSMNRVIGTFKDVQSVYSVSYGKRFLETLK